MSYPQWIEKELKKKKISPGDRVRVKSGVQTFEGILLPRIEAGDENALVIKLDSGYNTGIKWGAKTRLEKLPEKAALEKAFARKPASHKGLPEIALVSTGGTISARVDYRLGGVKPALSAEEIIFSAPELGGVVNFKSVSSPFRIFSENITPREWQAIAKEVAKELNSGAGGAIVTHGTDTLHFTSAALAFMLEGLNKPVALVGAQRSPDRASFDGPLNLACAAHYAARSDVAEVAIVMHATSSDDYCTALRGTKTRKMHTSRRDAFRPVNDLPLAKIWPDGRIEKMQAHKVRDNDRKVVADTKFEEKTALVKAYPGAPPELIDFLVDKKYRGIVVEATGLGHVPTEPLHKEFSWAGALERAAEKGVSIAFAAQCLYGSTSPFVYEQARLAQKLGAFSCKDMLPEVAYVKLGWVLGHEKKPEIIREKMLTNVAGEINDRLTEKHFLV